MENLLAPKSISQPAWTDLRNKLVGSEAYAERQLSDIKYLVVHHSGVDVDSTALSIARHHVETLGWPGIGYHFVIHWNGDIDYVGDIETLRYNVSSRNKECLGICLVGDYNTRHPRAAQRIRTHVLLIYLQRLIPAAKIVGHRDIALPGYESACPGATWPEWRNKLI